jgi:hypothetical protein
MRWTDRQREPACAIRAARWHGQPVATRPGEPEVRTRAAGEAGGRQTCGTARRSALQPHRGARVVLGRRSGRCRDVWPARATPAPNRPRAGSWVPLAAEGPRPRRLWGDRRPATPRALPRRLGSLPRLGADKKVPTRTGAPLRQPAQCGHRDRCSAPATGQQLTCNPPRAGTDQRWSNCDLSAQLRHREMCANETPKTEGARRVPLRDLGLLPVSSTHPPEGVLHCMGNLVEGGGREGDDPEGERREQHSPGCRRSLAWVRVARPRTTTSPIAGTCRQPSEPTSSPRCGTRGQARCGHGRCRWKGSHRAGLAGALAGQHRRQPRAASHARELSGQRQPAAGADPGPPPPGPAAARVPRGGVPVAAGQRALPHDRPAGPPGPQGRHAAGTDHSQRCDPSAGVRPVRLHDARHTAATSCSQQASTPAS